MKIKFTKYQGTGNDFILIDHASASEIHKSHNKLGQHDVRNLCDRNFGIGADGLIIISNTEGFDFKMDYFNSDGNPSTMCGNGGRCAVAFANRLGLISNNTNFTAVDGAHSASINGNVVALGMQNVTNIDTHETFFQLDTGSPHYVTFVEDTNDINVAQEGAMIRNSPMFAEEGINVNFVQEHADNQLFVRTYERGVEAETQSCGTGVTAASLVQMMRKNINEINVQTLGGNLSVRADNSNNSFTNIELIGPAQFVFEGKFDLDE